MRLRASLAFPVTMIIAAAGFGKTNAIRQFLSEYQEHVFIQTPNAASFQKFIREFSRSCSARFPLMMAPPDEIPNVDENIDDMIEVYSAWATTHLRNANCLIVVDDLQFADADPSVGMFLSRLVDETKGQLRWLFSSRTRGHLPLTRWQAYEYADAPITADDLRMTEEETLFFADVVGCPASQDQLLCWRRQTNGFPVSLTFAIRMSARQGTIDGVFDGTQTLTFDFLAEHLWVTLNSEDHEFLQVAALIPEVHIHHFETIGLSRAARRAAYLSADIPFLSISNDGIFAMHDLFRTFVLQRIQLSGLTESRALRISAIKVLECAKRYDDLLRFHIEDNNVDEICRIIETIGDADLDHDLTRSVLDVCRGLDISQLGVAMLSRQTKHWSWSGDSHRVHVFAEALINHGGAKPRDILLAFQATYRSVYMKPAAQQLEWLHNLEQHISRLDKSCQLQISAYRASILARNETTRELAQEIIDDIADKFDTLGLEDRISTELQVASASYWLGNKVAALDFARCAVSTASVLGDLRQRARTLNNLGITLLGNYDSEVENLFESSRQAVESTGSWLFCHVSHWFPAFYFALQGDADSAKRGRTLHNSVHPLEDTQRSLFRSVRRHSVNLGNILDEKYADVIRDSMSNPPVPQADMRYALHVDAAIAHIFISEEASVNLALTNVARSRNDLSRHEFESVSETVLMEVICLAASGKKPKARKLFANALSPAPALMIAREAVQIFLDGPPFIGLRESLEHCKNRPFVGLSALLMDRLAIKLEGSAIDVNLTTAETDVLKLLSLGKSNKAIAEARSRSTETVKRQVAAIYKKLGVENRTSALAAAKELGLV